MPFRTQMLVLASATCSKLQTNSTYQQIGTISNRFYASNSSPAASTSASTPSLLNLKTCPSCGTRLPTWLPTCSSCFYIAPIPSETPPKFYHALLGLSPEPNPFVVDAAQLKRNFLSAQRICHPDAWSSKESTLQAVAASQSSLLNKAYQTLLSPVQRAQYILAQHGQETLEADQLESHALIMEVMEAREELDDADSEEDIECIRKQNKERIASTIQDLEKAFAEEDYTAAKEASIRLKYWDGIEDAARAKLRDS